MKKCNVKMFLIVLFLIFGGSSFSSAQAVSCLRESSLKWIPFFWEGDSISGKYIEKAYLYVPVKIEDLPYDFSMQLDLVTSNTQFYGIPLKPYLSESTSLANKLGDYQGTAKDALLTNVNLKMGNVDFQCDILHFQKRGEEIPKDSLHSKTPKHIGTIAPDIFKDKILIIDYRLCRFSVLDSLPAEYKDLPAKTFELDEGIVKIPFRINGTEQKLMFDTGSSPFPLATSKERALEIAGPTIIDSLSGPLWWGQEITFYGLEVNKHIEFDGVVLENTKVYYDRDGLWEEGVFKPLGIWGLTGNACFFDHVVILDYKNKLFRIDRN